MNDHAVELRVAQFTVHFRQIGDSQMRDLPFYNAKLDVEAIEFRRLNVESLVGALITPWFMNLIVLPLLAEATVPNRYGEARAIMLPAGALPFRYGGDADIGVYWGHSLHSPMQKFGSQAQARSEAQQRLRQAMTVPAATPAAPNLSRRAFLTGARRSSNSA